MAFTKAQERSQGVWTKCWRSARHCCCRFGWYPVLVAPILTAGCLFSLYSTAGCEFVDLNVGFVPSNAAWNQSEAGLGMFYYQQVGAEFDNDIKQTLHTECMAYSNLFTDEWIENDRTWKVARIMAMIAGIGSLCASMVAWFFCLSPLPPNLIWPSILLPLVMISFIAEGSKFLIFDISLCRSSLWTPSGVDSLPQSAESCTLGTSAFYGIAAGSCLLIALLLVCLHTPEARDLDPDYGVVYATGAIHDLEADNDTDSDHCYPQRTTAPPSSTLHEDDESVFLPEESELDAYDVYNESSIQQSTLTDDHADLSLDDGTRSTEDTPDHREPLGNYTGSSQDLRDSQPDPGEDLVKPGAQRVSESRLSKVAKMELTLSAGSDDENHNAMIENFVSDLDSSFAEGPAGHAYTDTSA